MSVSTAVACPRGRRLDFRQAMAYLGLEGAAGQQRLRQLIATRRIPVYRDGRLFFFDRELDAWLDRVRTPSVDEPKSKHIELPTPSAAGLRGIEDLMPRHRRLSRVG